MRVDVPSPRARHRRWQGAAARRRANSICKPGKHTIAIAAARYQPFTGEIEVIGEGKSQTFTPQLVPAWAEVTVTSEPAGAQVFVDGEDRGVTPLTTQIMAGNHPVELQMEGFKPWTTDVQVKANEPLSLGPIRLGLPDGRLAVRSEPSGASVSVGGVYRGQTPRDAGVAAGHGTQRRADTAGLRSRDSRGVVAAQAKVARCRCRCPASSAK